MPLNRPMPTASQPALTVAAIAEQDGRFLLVEELIRGRRLLNQPAGHVEPGEALLEAVVRETLEETAWHFCPEAVTGIYMWRPDARSRGFLRVVFSGRLLARDCGRRLDRGIVRALWLSHDELRSQPPQSLRSPMVLRAIDDYLGGHRTDPCALAGLDLAGLRARAVTLSER